MVLPSDEKNLIEDGKTHDEVRSNKILNPKTNKF